jgi:hypothetical protein
MEQKTKKSKLGLIILLIVLIIIIAGTLGYYFMFYTNPVNTYKRLLDDATKEAMVALKEANTEKAEIETKLKANIELKDETVDQKIIDLINKTDIISTIQFDKENKQMTVKLDANYDSKDLLDIELFNDSKNKKTYLYAKDLLDAYLEVPIDNYSEIEDSYTATNMFMAKDEESAEKIKTIINNELIKVIKEEYCSKQSEGLNNIYVFKINEVQLAQEIKSIVTNLKSNNEFISCYEDANAVKESLENIITGIDESKCVESNVIELNVYTTGLAQNFEKLVIKMNINEEKVEVTSKNVDDVLNIDFKIVETTENKEITGTIKVSGDKTNQTVEFSADSAEIGKIYVKADLSNKQLSVMDQIDTSNVKSIEELTTADILQILSKLQASGTLDTLGLTDIF